MYLRGPLIIAGGKQLCLRKCLSTQFAKSWWWTMACIVSRHREALIQIEICDLGLPTQRKVHTARSALRLIFPGIVLCWKLNLFKLKMISVQIKCFFANIPVYTYLPLCVLRHFAVSTFPLCGLVAETKCQTGKSVRGNKRVFTANAQQSSSMEQKQPLRVNCLRFSILKIS